MTPSTALLDVGIGLALIFFIVASAAAAINEAITRLLDIRAKVLWKALANTIDSTEGEPLKIGFFDSMSWFLFTDDRPEIKNGRSEKLTEKLANTRLIKSLGGKTLVRDRSRVDEIAAETFSAALLQTAKLGGRDELVSALNSTRTALWHARQPEPVATTVIDELSKANEPRQLRVLLGEAGLDEDLAQPVEVSQEKWAVAAQDESLVDDAVATNAALASGVDRLSRALELDMIGAVRDLTANTTLGEVVGLAADSASATINDIVLGVNTWFDREMTRLSTLYRLAARKILFAAGLALAVAFNVNAIELVNDLRNNADARDALVAVADQCVSESEAEDPLQDCLDVIEGKFENESQEVSLPVVGGYQPPWESIGYQGGDWKAPSTNDLIEVIVGWTLTGIAVSFGAPFWFGLIQKLSTFRGSAKSS